jgi:NAD-dependent dihydropyrimidine dehydrogenase PreA subunit
MKRKIIKIDEEKCNGCGLCVPNCAENALKIIDGKARLIDDVVCDGLGGCLGDCPEGALTLEEREAQPFDEGKVLENLVQKEAAYMENYLRKLSVGGDSEIHKEYDHFLKMIKEEPAGPGCPGLAPAALEKKIPNTVDSRQENVRQSELMQWPIQLHLVNPLSNLFSGKDVVLAADCVAYSLTDFHSRFLKGKRLVIACAKLDRDVELYTEELRLMVDEAKINTLTVIIMQVACCRGLLQIAQEALQKAKRKVPLKAIIISTQGEVLSEEWV